MPPIRERARRGRDRRVRLRGADEREGVPARQVRPRRAGHARTSTTTAATACRAPRPAANRAFGIDRGLPFPVARHRAGRSGPAGRVERGRHAAADHAVVRAAEAGRRPARSSSTRAAPPPPAPPTCTCQLTPGHRPRARQRPALVAIEEGLIDARVHRGPHHRLRRGPPDGAARTTRPTSSG